MNLPNIGPLLLRALINQDMYLAGSILLIYCFLTIVGTLMSDILLALIDPRIRDGERAWRDVGHARSRSASSDAEERIAVASNWTLVWWRFRKHHLAMVCAGVLIFLYLIVLCARFLLAPRTRSSPKRARPSFRCRRCTCSMTAGSRPWVPAIVGKRNPVTLRMEWTIDPQTQDAGALLRAGLRLSQVFGLFETNLHLIGAGRSGAAHLPAGLRSAGARSMVAHHARHADLDDHRPGRRDAERHPGRRAGRHLRLFRRHRPTRSSSALIELLQSVPTIPIWLALSAALPRDWTPIQVFFAITIILSLIGWTTLGARSARPLPGAARGGFRAGRPAGRLLAHAHHHAPHGADLHQPHHRHQLAGHPGDDHQRDVAVVSSASASARRPSAGACCCRRRRTSRPWRWRRGC